jgi:hypothetical protein
MTKLLMMRGLFNQYRKASIRKARTGDQPAG